MRRIAIAGALIAFTFCLAVSVLWLIEARQAKAVIGGWNGRPIANRLVFTDAAAEIGGFPFGLDINLAGRADDGGQPSSLSGSTSARAQRHLVAQSFRV